MSYFLKHFCSIINLWRLILTRIQFFDHIPIHLKMAYSATQLHLNTRLQYHTITSETGLQCHTIISEIRSQWAQLHLKMASRTTQLHLKSACSVHNYICGMANRTTQLHLKIGMQCHFIVHGKWRIVPHIDTWKMVYSAVNWHFGNGVQ